MNILLLNLTELVDEQGQPKKYIIPQLSVPPIGLLYIGQMLHDNGYTVKVYDQTVTAENNTDVMNLIKSLNPDLVGFSVLIDNLWTTIDLFEKLKNWNPNLITIAGNYFATFFPEKLMNKIKFDFCIHGEGEYMFLDLVNHLSKGKKDFAEIKGLTYRENGVIKSTSLPEKIRNLDDLPIPDRKLIDFNYRFNGKSTSILSSRGCPYTCRFCNFSAVMGKAWRPRSAQNVAEEIKLLKDQGYKDILFIDDNFTLSKKRIFQLCAEIRRNHLDDLSFSGDCRVDNASFDILRALVSSNFIQVLFGIESGTQRILDYYKKGVTVSQIKQAVKNAQKVRIENIYASFVLGAPDETYSEMVNTIKFAYKLPLTFLVFQILYVIPISPIYKELIEQGYYTPGKDDWTKVLKVPDICKTVVPKNLLLKLIDEAFIRFFNKKRLAKLILNTLIKNSEIETVINSIKKVREGTV